jgi:hypothetical protein
MGSEEGRLPPGIAHYLKAEFSRLANDRPALTFEQLAQFKGIEDYPLRFTHLGVLHLLDGDRDGLFTLSELTEFAGWCMVRSKAAAPD